ncbi:MAG: cell division protein SepF [Nakamurella sp.]
MSSWRKMGAFLGLVAQDDSGRSEFDYPDAEYGAEYDTSYGSERGSAQPTDYAPRVARESTNRQSTRQSSDPSPEPVVHGALAMQMHPQQQQRRASESGNAARPLTVKLTGFAEARVIGERYREGSSVILDMTNLSDGDARRVVDFAAGLAFAQHGSIDKVTARVFMLLPPHMDMSAEDRRAFAAGGWRS